MGQFHPIIPVVDDGLHMPEIGAWADEKYRLVGHYMNIFTHSMHKKWKLVYIDLFAGAGYAKVRNTNRILKTSSLIAMSLPFKFDKYILSEFEEHNVTALKKRVARLHPDLDVEIVQGDTNENINEICLKIPPDDEKPVLCFCFVDPFSLNLHFDTIKRISHCRVDFLILLATNMDLKRNYVYYKNEENGKVDKFLGYDNWREEYRTSASDMNIITFCAMKYDQNMINLGYTEPALKEQIRSYERNLPLYHLAFYSRHELGNEFWGIIRKLRGSGQIELF